jgi:DNA-binding beta-propeller fold protein YncE
MARASSSVPAYFDIRERAVATIVVPGYVDFLAADGRAVWATNTDRVERFEIDQPRPVATVPIPGACGAMVVAYGSLWVASCVGSSIYRIDLVSHLVKAVIETGLADPTGELSLAAGAGSIWVLSSAAGVLSRIDADTNAIVARIDVLPESYAAAYGDDAVWVSNTGSRSGGAAGSVQRIDPRRDEVVATIATGPAPCFLAADAIAAWTLNWGDGSVTRIDAMTDQAIVTIPLGMEGGGGDIAIGGNRIWVRGTKVLLAAVDPNKNVVSDVFGPPAGSGAVRVADDLVWITAHDINTIWVLETSSLDGP